MNRRIACVVFALLIGVAVRAQRNTILPVYRDLLKPAPFTEATYYDRCGAGTGPLEVLRADTPRAEVEALVRDLDAADVVGLAQRSLDRAARILPGASVTICLFPGELSRGLPYLDGVGGIALGGGHIKLLLHPKPGGLRRVTYTVAHEYHHEVERNIGPSGYGPIDVLIREGKADYFAVGLYPDLRPPHTKPLSDAEFKLAWRELLDYEQSQPPPATFRADFMVGRNPRVLPWPGYRLGYELVDHYMRGKQLTPTESIKVPSRVIFDYFRQHGRRP